MSPSPANSRDAFPATDGIHQLPVLSDNIIWIWVRGHQAVVVDLAVAEPVITWLEARELELEAIMGAVIELAHMTGIATPAIDSIYALTKLLDKTMREDHGAVQLRHIA